MKQIKILARGAGIAFIGLFISKLLGYVYRLITARIGAEPYGLVSIALGVVSLLVLFPLMGLDSGVVRFIAYYKGKNNNNKIYNSLRFSLTLTLILSFWVSILLFIFSDKIAILIFHNIKLGLILKLFSVAIPFYVIERISLAALKAIKKNQYEVYSKAIFNNTSKIILTFLLVYVLRLELLGLSVAFLVSVIGMGLLSFYFMYYNIFKDLNRAPFVIEKELFSYSWPLMFFSFFYLILAWTDTLMVGYFLDASQVGIYNVALPTASLLVVFPTALKSLFLPIITLLYAQKEKEKIKQVYSSLTRWTFLINLPILLIFVIFSKQFLGILFGKEYISGFSCLVILSISYFLLCLFECSATLLNMLKKNKIILLNGIIVAVLNIILNSVLIPLYGIFGGAIATSISLIILGLLYCLEGWFYTGLQPFRLYYFKVLVMLSIIFIIIFELSKIIRIVTFIDLAFFSFYIIGIYVALILLTKSLKKEDVTLFKDCILKLKSILK